MTYLTYVVIPTKYRSYLVNLSTTSRMALNPSSINGRLVAKSRHNVDSDVRSVSTGCMSLYGRPRLGLAFWHSGQVETYLAMRLLMLQKKTIFRSMS